MLAPRPPPRVQVLNTQQQQLALSHNMPSAQTIHLSTSSSITPGFQGSTTGSRRDSIIASTDVQQAECHQQLRQHAEEILAACPGLPGLCPRPANLHGAGGDSYRLAEGPNDAAMAQQKALVDSFVTGQGLKVSDNNSSASSSSSRDVISPAFHG